MREVPAKCELCESNGGTVLWVSEECRVVRVDDAHYPGFCRVIWQSHVREMTDLEAAAQQHLMRVVFAVESTLRTLFRPDKINLASFGNVVPHLHWHVIPRWRNDRHFPESVWGGVRNPKAVPGIQVDDGELAAALAERLGNSLPGALS